MSRKRGGDYEVGYRKPPKHTQFQSGQSGNPRGRPKRSESLAAAVDRELKRKIVVREGGEPRTMSKHKAMAKQLVNKALAGDLQATKLVLQLRAQAAAERAATAPVIDAEPELPGFDPNLLKTEELDILARALERMDKRRPYHERPPVPVPPGEPWDPDDDG